MRALRISAALRSGSAGCPEVVDQLLPLWGMVSNALR
jgi:hypothetical protein